ncbi:hypothetical protein HanIR_Chr03g0106381 [Helianthus annuus]|nr:hypothetical protein HanIR_Chr03g0106381 [Helianthus annuus]
MQTDKRVLNSLKLQLKRTLKLKQSFWAKLYKFFIKEPKFSPGFCLKQLITKFKFLKLTTTHMKKLALCKHAKGYYITLKKKQSFWAKFNNFFIKKLKFLHGSCLKQMITNFNFIKLTKTHMKKKKKKKHPCIMQTCKRVLNNL